MCAEPVAVKTEKITSEVTVAVIRQTMLEVLERQRRAYLEEGPPSLETRLDRLDRAIALLVDHRQAIVEALSQDFGHRSPQQTLLTDVGGSIEPLKFAKKRVARWMRPEKRRPNFPFGLLGARAEIHYQPLGVVGVISPWNFPVNLTFAPLAGILAAGNRAMIKPSELTPATSDLMKQMIGSAFDETELAVMTGGPEVGKAFSGLPFDHLLFTGGTAIAYHVMKAAAENLTPVTLELGGKSPVVVGKGAEIGDVARKVMTGKMLNAGQICLAPDYVLVPDEAVASFVDAAKQAVAEMYPTLRENPDYTSVVNARHRARLESYLEDAEKRGAELVEINPAAEDMSVQAANKMAPTLVLGADDDMAVMQNEIFGPVLPVKPYGQIDEAIDFINARPRPLGLYYFGNDEAERDRVLSRTTSGGVTVNDVVMHVMMEDLPFGGVGPSGMGAYHGHEGFKTFSHAKSVYRQAKLDIGKMVRPPYGKGLSRLLAQQIKK